MIDREKILHIAHLARLELTEEEISDYMTKLNDILSYVERLQSVDTENTDITYNPNGSYNAFRNDEVRPSLERESVLQNAPDSEMGCFKVPKVLD
ncbi:aspartyl/glutamyl-tRNA(Asn/Gln) amidotransferase subunit C [Peptoclostridium litorale DSM 5388]|uniref:Aspartyl/glutamyl-tRNA(Asn/Gln) amidotransferase subunit C n=1 Tax=Peptoclostridium litorale DSM 5388 TaxID=1121324 RepID=A0A069RF84_PEPLI|nr:Asp-tRNA(Asn)/Glu-tRNA(Gln) amidotransferase subunit GatC [Peptoclostridium litorale]KDR95689.1 hypothetical protein CLIT_10c04160 [Peptoclostridium litorale DSM 5388]SIO01150.1 aspartyl/glutamyl-tRNA(Asn/Gln) amidotransferase subunit C [Peptoclostridium litorale DSM 5388]